MTDVIIQGASGLEYPFEAFAYNGDWNDCPGLYAFAYRDVWGWHILYVGICDSFKSRMCAHEKWDAAVRRGATHVLARLNANAYARAYEEQDLIAKYSPPLNSHYNIKRA